MLVLAVLCAASFAQVQNGQISGLVVDPSDAVVASAQIRARNLDTGFSASVVSNGLGIYTLQELPVGRYRITVAVPGFKTATTDDVILHVGDSLRVDLKLVVGHAVETIEVTDAAAAVNTENARVTENIDARQIENLPLNGRNVFDLIKYSPGATDVRGLMFESSVGTVVNGVRQSFNGFILNGVSDKGLSGSPVNQPILDTVQEVQVLTLNNSAEFGDSAGAITSLVTKAGTNQWHGSAWEFFRNDALDANDFYANHYANAADRQKLQLRLNQFGATVGGPFRRNKLFLFAGYQGDRVLASGTFPVQVESPQFRNATESAFPNSVAALLYSNFPVHGTGVPSLTLRKYVEGQYSASGFASFADYLCPANSDGTGALSSKFATLFGVEQADIDELNQGGCPGGSPYAAPFAGTFNRDDTFLINVPQLYKSQVGDELVDGNEASLRLDYTATEHDRLFTQFNWSKSHDKFNANFNTPRGFFNPAQFTTPNFQFNYTHSFTPAVLNEFRAGYALNSSTVDVATPGVPSIELGDGTLGFGSYNGYPQLFAENIYNYSDLVSANHGKHTLKAGAEFKRNIDKDNVNVGRPSYYFFDPLFFAIDTPEVEAAGVDPGLITGVPAHLQGNARHFRNLELGFYVQDDWKVFRRLTLNLGLRYDLYTRPVELDHLATTFLRGPGHSLIDNITTGAGQIKNASTPCPGDPLATLAGECGPGGFTPTNNLGAGDHNNFGPRIGFAWDPVGKGRTSLRGGFGIAYEGTLFTPLTDSRWNPPYYSFDQVAAKFLVPDNNIVYGPVAGGSPTFLGPAPPSQHSGAGPQATGNISGWDPTNPHLGLFTAIVFPGGVRDPYVENWFFGIQHQLLPGLVVETNYVGTAGRKLIRAESVNRVPGARLPEGTCVLDNFGRKLCSQVNTNLAPNGEVLNFTGWLNPNYGHLRVFENAANSIYHGLQLSVRKKLSRGLQFRANYTYSHAIDSGSAWHNGATSANGFAAGDAFTTDVTLPGLDRGNSTFDIRHRLTLVYVWEIPFLQARHGVLGATLGGWQVNGIWSFQSGAHWTPFRGGAFAGSNLQGSCTPPDFDPTQCLNVGADYNLDGEANDRPNAVANHVNATHAQWADGFKLPANFFSAPCLGCVGNLGRNTFVGPSFWDADISLFRNFRLTERVRARLRVEGFNVFNRTNFRIGNNQINDPFFGQAGGTFNPRNLQLGIQLAF